MSDVVMLPVAWIKAALFAAALAIVGAILLGRSCAPDPAPLPPAVQARLDRHVATSIADTVKTRRLEEDTAGAARQQRSAAAESRRLELVATREKTRADSFAAVAAQATSARDSAIAYHAALDASQARGDTLTAVLVATGAQLQAAAARQAATDSIADIWKAHALRADSLVMTLLPLAEHRDRCKIAWVISCPTRKQALVGGVLLGAAGYAIATGKIRIPLKF